MRLTDSPPFYLSMIEISHLRNDLEGLTLRDFTQKIPCDLDALVELDQKRREAISAAEQARAGQKAANNEMSQLPRDRPNFSPR
jgi:seryl-tRNA synthetase